MPYFIFLGGVIVLFILWTISINRSIVVLDENIKNAIAQIGVQLSSRWEALSLLIELTKGYSEDEYIALTETIKARCSITKDSSPKDINKQEYVIAGAIEKILALAEHYPALRFDKIFIKTMDGVNQYEKMIQTSRLIYNDSVTKLNRSIGAFPVFLIAGLLGFSKRAFLEEQDVIYIKNQ